jgi:hypothetical protein
LATLPDDILARLDELRPDCPGCHGDLKAESDDRMRTGFAWYCPNRDCTEHGGCWIVAERDFTKAAKS